MRLPRVCTCSCTSARADSSTLQWERMPEGTKGTKGSDNHACTNSCTFRLSTLPNASTSDADANTSADGTINTSTDGTAAPTTPIVLDCVVAVLPDLTGCK